MMDAASQKVQSWRELAKDFCLLQSDKIKPNWLYWMFNDAMEIGVLDQWDFTVGGGNPYWYDRNRNKVSEKLLKNKEKN